MLVRVAFVTTLHLITLSFPVGMSMVLVGIDSVIVLQEDDYAVDLAAYPGIVVSEPQELFIFAKRKKREAQAVLHVSIEGRALQVVVQ